MSLMRGSSLLAYLKQGLAFAASLGAASASFAGLEYLPETASVKIEIPMGEISGYPAMMRWTSAGSWSCSLDISLTKDASGAVAIKALCLKHVFLPSGSGQFVASPEGAPGTLELSRGDYVFRSFLPVALKFSSNGAFKGFQSADFGAASASLDSKGRLSGWKAESSGVSAVSFDDNFQLQSSSRQGGRIEWGAEGLPAKISFGGKSFSIKCSGAGPSEISSSDGGLWKIDYDSSGRPAKFSDGAHDYSILYNSEGRVSALVDAKGDSICYSYQPRPDNGPGFIVKAVNLSNGFWTLWTIAPGLLRQEDFTPRNVLARRMESDLLTGETLVSLPDGTKVESAPLPDGSVRTVSLSPGQDGSVSISKAAETVTFSFAGEEKFRQRTVQDQSSPTPGEFRAKDGVVTLPDGRPLKLIVSGDAAGSCKYDEKGRLASVALPGGAVSTFSYNPDGRLSAVKTPDGGEIAFSYDKKDGVMETKFPDGSFERRWYDSKARPFRLQQPLGRDTIFVYDGPNGSSSIRLEGFDSRTWRFPKGSDLAIASSGLSGIWTFLRSPSAPSCIIRTAPDGTSVFYSYDNAGKLAGIKDSAGEELASFSLDSLGLPSAASSKAATLSIERDAFGREVSRSLASPQYAVKSSYGANGRLDALSDSAGETIEIQGGPPAKTASLNSSSAGLFKFEYGSAGLPISLSRPNAIKTVWIYDEASRLKELRHIFPLGQKTVVRSFKYDAMGRLSEISDPDSGTASISYDALSRPSSIADPASKLELSFDPWGNLLKAGGGAVEYSGPGIPSALGQSKYLCDKFARLAKLSGPSGDIELSYDWNWRLASAKLPGGKSCSWDYDAFSNLCLHSSPDGKGTAILNVQGSMLSTIDVASGGTTRYVFLPGFRECLAIVRPDGSVHYPVCDHEGTIVALADKQGKLFAARSFSPLGAPSSSDSMGVILGWRNSLSFLGGRLILLDGKFCLPEIARALAPPSLQPGDNGLSASNALSMFEVDNSGLVAQLMAGGQLR